MKPKQKKAPKKIKNYNDWPLDELEADLGRLLTQEEKDCIVSTYNERGDGGFGWHCIKNPNIPSKNIKKVAEVDNHKDNSSGVP